MNADRQTMLSQMQAEQAKLTEQLLQNREKMRSILTQ